MFICVGGLLNTRVLAKNAIATSVPTQKTLLLLFGIFIASRRGVQNVKVASPSKCSQLQNGSETMAACPYIPASPSFTWAGVSRHFSAAVRKSSKYLSTLSRVLFVTQIWQHGGLCIRGMSHPFASFISSATL